MIGQLADKKWLQDFRKQQLEQFVSRGYPTRKEEAWKYTNVTALEKAAFKLSEHQEVTYSVTSLPQSISLVFLNGFYSEALSNTQLLPKDILLCSTSQAIKQHEEKIKPYLLRHYDAQRFPFAVLSTAQMTDGLFLHVPKNKELTVTIHVLFVNTQKHNFVTAPRNIIVADKNSGIKIIEEHLGYQAERYFTNVVTDIYADENARVDYYKIQDESLTATHIANIFVEQRASCVRTYFLSRGSLLAREDLTIQQNAESAESRLHGLYLLNHDQQHIDHHVHVDHRAEHGTSSMVYKGILDKKSRAVFNGKVFVHPNAQKINAHQENHNLLLSADAEVNTKPELEIYADDVKCTHGATVGQLDSDALFYLCSRGIQKQEGLKILTHAFAEEIFSKVDDVTIRHYLKQRMNSHVEL